MEDDPVINAQLRKLESEIARNAAEERKLLVEAAEIDKKAAKGSIQVDSIIKTVIGSLITAGLLTAWFINLLQPLYEKKAELASLENKKACDSLQELNRLANQQLKDVQNEKESVRNEQKKLKELIKDLQNKSTQIANVYRRLSEQDKSTQADKEKYARLATEAKLNTNILQNQLTRLDASQQKSRNGSATISDKLTAFFLAANDWDITCVWDGSPALCVSLSFKLNGAVSFGSINGSWQIRDGELTMQLTGATYTGEVSELQNFFEGTMIAVDDAANGKLQKSSIKVCEVITHSFLLLIV